MKKRVVITNMFWRFAERCGAQGVSFVVTLILARLLMPEVYGTVALITVFTTILTLFVDSGLKNALIQKKDSDQLDFSTVFYCNVALGIVLYLGMVLAAPSIARFYQNEEMVAYVRVLSLTLVLGGVNGVQTAIVSKRMQFRKYFYATLGGTLISAVIGIAMAVWGMGVWALIAQRLTNQAIDTLILWVTVRWRPSRQFSMERLRPMFGYGSKILCSSLLDSLTANVSGLLIGTMYSADSLAYYDKGRNVPFFVIQNIQTAVQSVLLPVIAEEQNRTEQVRRILKQSIQVSAYCIIPCMVGLGVCAEPLIRVLFTERWIEMVPFLRLWCFVCAFYLLHTANLQVIQALGHSGLYLRIEIVKQVLSLAGIFIAIPFGVLAMMQAMCVVTVISLYLNAKPNQTLIGYGFAAQIKDLVPILFLNLIMGVVIFVVGLLPLGDVPLLLVQGTVGVGVYLVGSRLLDLEIAQYLWDTLHELRMYTK